MNVLPGTFQDASAWSGGHEIPMGRHFSAATGAVSIGCRPEFTRLSANGGLPVTINRVEDVGRHKIVRADFQGTEVNAILPEGAEIGADQTQMIFDPNHTHIYVDDRIIDSDERRAGIVSVSGGAVA